MTRKGYTNVSIAEELIKDVDGILENKTKGYRSRAEFISAAIRHELEKYNKD